MKKIIIIGCPGSGKTTFAEKLKDKIGLPLFYLDAIWHKPDRTHISREEFDARLAEILALDAWIIDGNYSRTIEPRISACDTVFLFDLPAEACLEGAISRLGKARRDMPWCDTELDVQLKKEIEEFGNKNLPTIYALLDKYQSGKRVVFKNREEADAFLAGMAKVIVLPYDAAWRLQFEQIKTELEAAVGELAVGIEHVGSTSVVGLAAKPCIDVDMVIEDMAVFDAVRYRLEKIGYIHEGDLGIAGREAFRYESKPHLQRHHLYVCPRSSAELHRHVTFRDFLRQNSDVVKRYGEVKMAAAMLYPNDIEKYLAHKAPVIEEIYAQCGLK